MVEGQPQEPGQGAAATTSMLRVPPAVHTTGASFAELRWLPVACSRSIAHVQQAAHVGADGAVRVLLAVLVAVHGHLRRAGQPS